MVAMKRFKEVGDGKGWVRLVHQTNAGTCIEIPGLREPFGGVPRFS